MGPGHAICRPVVVLAIGGSLLLSGCSRTSDSDLAKAKAAGASEAAASQKIKSQEEAQAKLAAEVKKLQAEAAKAKAVVPVPSTAAPAAPAPVPAPAAPAAPAPAARQGTSCGGNLSVGANTSCAFAANVESAFYAQGSGSVDVYSPVTGRWYTMNCVSGVPTVCRGGNNAVVYIR